MIDAADEGDDAGAEAGVEAGGDAGPGDGGDVASVAGDGDPLPPQEATPATSKASAIQRAVDAAFKAVGILSLSIDMKCHAWRAATCPTVDAPASVTPWWASMAAVLFVAEERIHESSRFSDGSAGRQAVRAARAMIRSHRAGVMPKC
ncbi:hypothetical protein [Pelomonas aquatica]|uniref:hypothetical protein n=1 Tax=Pelomonas aquatica TaxID=431058 RepID=UPI00286A4979|nr:hypothetical protein [Pelomonas aquatica]